MKKANVTITFEKEKLDALQYYLGKKEIDLANELVETIAKLYEKHVPGSTREYIEDRLIKEAKPETAAKTEKPLSGVLANPMLNGSQNQ